MAKRIEGEKEDLRQRRSRRLMSQALLELMGERPYREISVVDICQRAMVHRTTFYAHFEDKNALLRYVLGQLQEHFRADQDELLEHGEARPYLRAVFLSELRFLKAHQELYFAGLSDYGAEVRLVEDSMAESLTRAYHTFGETEKSEAEIQVIAQFYTGALLSVVRWWLESKVPVSEEELVEMVDKLLPDTIGE